MKNEKRKGYTLLEVLVVSVIVVTLAAIALPLYNKTISKTNVADALTNISMLSEAQGKYFISNGLYARNINSLDTPLKGSGGNIVTANFNYYMGNPQNDDYCIYAESNRQDYVLAKNYRNNSKVLCSGADCNKVESVETGELDGTCTGNGSECNVTCTAPKVLRNCSCVCEITAEDCPANATFDSTNCTCNSPEEEQCPSPQVKGKDGKCGCMVDNEHPPFLWEKVAEPTVFPVGTDCATDGVGTGFGFSTAIAEDCTCKCNEEGLIRACGGMQCGYDVESCGCAFCGPCGGSANYVPSPCAEGYARLDVCGDCELLVECPPGQVQVPGNPDDYGGLPSGLCGCLITGNAPPYVWNVNGEYLLGTDGNSYVPPGTRCSNDRDDKSLPGRLTSDCQCAE